jgi:NodT family efflux transporter outer membrane factor (OMF) lipoprotein
MEGCVTGMTKAYAILACSILLLACGCLKVGPDFRRPSANVSGAWLDANDVRIKAGAADYRQWWRAFNDSALNTLIQRAYVGNLSLQTAAVRVLQARAQLGIAIGEFYPQTQQGIGSLQYNRLSGSSTLAGFSSNREYLQSQLGGQASWELDFWGKYRRAIESADAGLLASLADYDNTLVTLTADVANSYITIRTAQERIRIARENVGTQQESLNIAEARFQNGVASQLDVEQARTSLLNTQASIPPLETQLRQGQDALSVLLGTPPGDLNDLLKGPSGIPTSSPQIIVGIPADLLRRRPDVRSAEMRAAAQSAQIGVAKAELFPAFSLTGSLVFLATDAGTSKLGDMFRWSSRSVQTGPGVQWNLFNYGQITNNVRLQDARFQELLLTYQQTVLAAQQDVEDNLAAFLRAQDRADLLARSVTAARTALELAVSRYREGLVDFTTVLTAEQTLLSQQDNLAGTLGSISSNLVGVYRALGGGWEIRENQELVSPEVAARMKERTDWDGLLVPAAYNLPSSREPASAPRLPEW